MPSTSNAHTSCSFSECTFMCGENDRVPMNQSVLWPRWPVKHFFFFLTSRFPLFHQTDKLLDTRSKILLHRMKICRTNSLVKCHSRLPFTIGHIFRNNFPMKLQTIAQKKLEKKETKITTIYFIYSKWPSFDFCYCWLW